jgi:hypothetical protein
MPFATKFRAMMDMPFAGDTVGGFLVEHVDVRHESQGMGRYAYPVRIVLRGSGGQRGVREALKRLLSSHPMTFSGYGTPYQLWFGKPQIQSLGDKRYEVRVEGTGARLWLDEALDRFLVYLDETGQLAARPDARDRGARVEAYLTAYRTQVRRRVDRYRGRLRRSGGGT